MNPTPESIADARLRTSDLLARIATDPRGSEVTLDEIVAGFGIRAHGVLLLVAALAGFLPSPVGAGTIAGALAFIVGLQLLAGSARPWLPRFIAKRKVQRSSIAAFLERRGHWLGRIERLARPRLVRLFALPWSRLWGLAIVIHAVILGLPIPLTNYPLSAMLLPIAVALIEDDGALLLAGMVMIAVATVFLGSAAIGLVMTALALAG
jgi:hypothetical protein